MTSVILSIEEYVEIIEKLEDYEDIAYIEEMKKQGPMEYIPLEDYLKELEIEDARDNKS